ncbi:MAG: hypothetical protein ACOYNY_45520 [Caldilineaceae bacterium]
MAEAPKPKPFPFETPERSKSPERRAENPFPYRPPLNQMRQQVMKKTLLNGIGQRKFFPK